MKSFRVKNVKSFADSGKIEMAPLTIFVGQNSCGKSSLLRFPLVIAQSMHSYAGDILRFNGEFVDYGFFDNVIHKQKGDKITFEFTYDVNCDKDDRLYYYPREYEKVLLSKTGGIMKEITEASICIEMMKKDNQTIQKTASLLFGNKKVASWSDKDGKGHITLFYSVIDGKLQKCQFDLEVKDILWHGVFPVSTRYNAFEFICSKVYSKKKISKKMYKKLYEKLFPQENTKEKIDISEEEKKIVQMYLMTLLIDFVMNQLEETCQREAVATSYVGPFRNAPSRIYRDDEGENGISVGVRGENVSLILAKDFRNKKALINEISKWMQPVLGYKLSIDDLNNGFFQISLVDKNGIHSNISDVGFGVSQVLPIVTQLISAVNNWGKSKYRSIYKHVPVYIEQPELHLHPAAQAKLADLFARCIGDGTSPNRLVLETHSEHLIRKLQVLIADKSCALTNEMVKIYYVDKNTQGNACVKEMKIAPNGKFCCEWPEGFFDQAYRLTMDLLANNAEVL